MKSIIAVILTIVLAISIFAGCSNEEQLSTNPSTVPNSSTTAPSANPSSPLTDLNATAPSEEVDVLAFPEVETSAENISAYRAEVQARLTRKEFLTPEEEDLFLSLLDNSQQGYGRKIFHYFNGVITCCNLTYEEFSEYYFPVVFREGNSLILWYTTDYGEVLVKRIYGYWNQGNHIGTLHKDVRDEELLLSTESYRITWNKELSQVRVWKFNHVVESHQIPEGAIYAGHSWFEGYIFRQGTDVYALRLDTSEKYGTVERIATGVAFIITAEYRYGSDPWSQPLFLMEDGTVKCYISWEGDREAPADDPCHLVELSDEGGYHR